MSFPLPHFTPPDFSLPRFSQAPDAVLVPSPQDKVAPEQYHATTIFPEYFKIGGQWLLAKESRMDCVAVYENGNISAVMDGDLDGFINAYLKAQSLGALGHYGED